MRSRRGRRSSGEDVVWFVADDPADSPEWARTYGCGLDGVTWAPAASAGDEDVVVLAAANVGITPKLWGDRWCLPASRIARAHPRLRARMAKIEARAKEAMRSSN